MEIHSFGLSDPGLVRGQNQDAIFLPPSGQEEEGVFVLADGMGGASGGEVASGLAVEGISAAFAQARPRLGAEEGLRQAMAQAAASIHQRAQEQPQLKGMGTTAVALTLEGERAFLANVGDSRGYLWRQGQLMQVTQDHSLVQRMVAEGSLTPQEARRHHMRNVLTRVLGNAPSVEADVFSLALTPGDRLLLCSDGLHGPVEDQEIARVLSTKAGLEEQARALVALANQRGGPDNISVVLVAIDSLDADQAEATTRRTRVAAMASQAQTPKGRSWLPWLLLPLLLAAVGAGVYLWTSTAPPGPTVAVEGKVQLDPVGPTADSQVAPPSAEAQDDQAEGKEPSR